MIAVVGATGYVGGLLARHLAEGGEEVAALARHPERAEDLAAAGCEVRGADVLEAETLGPALEGAEVAYFLVHAMGRGGDGDFARREQQGARNFARAAAAAGVRRIVYLGGLGSGSEHLNSRHATAVTLRAGEVPVAYYRAAAVIGAGSESFRTVYYLVRRLPAMVTPRWTTIRTQPIAIADVVADLAAATDLSLPLDRELQIGGPDVTTYGGMIDELAQALDRRPPLRVTVPVLTPRLSSLWVGLVTPVDTGVARPLIEGLSHETVVDDPSGMEALPARPRIPLAEALRDAVEEVEAEEAAPA
ncbi:MAG TPA: NAD(P)H-binding protein [Solirubrobacterales bacterium]|nr:NAD(P)H-binding protein [Solirubrobacterales bacterium]